MFTDSKLRIYFTSNCRKIARVRYICNKFKKTRRRLLLCSEVDRARFTIHNTISAPNVSPHVPPPLPPLLVETANPPGPSPRCEPFAAKMLTPAS